MRVHPQIFFFPQHCLVLGRPNTMPTPLSGPFFHKKADAEARTPPGSNFLALRNSFQMWRVVVFQDRTKKYTPVPALRSFEHGSRERGWCLCLESFANPHSRQRGSARRTPYVHSEDTVSNLERPIMSFAVGNHISRARIIYRTERSIRNRAECSLPTSCRGILNRSSAFPKVLCPALSGNLYQKRLSGRRTAVPKAS